MSLRDPAYLLALPALALAAWLYVRHERRATRGRAAFASPAMLPSVAPVRPGWRRHLPPALYAVALAALIVALARPELTVAVEVEQARVLLVTDQSGSMAATDVRPSRLEAARDAASTFLERVPDEVQVGAIAFNQGARVLQTPTTDREAVREALAQIRPAGSTATGDALALALSVARRPARQGAKPPPSAIVLLSDGKSVRGRDPVEVAREAARQKVPVYTIALGTPQGTIRTRKGVEEVPPDAATMREVARLSGGRSFAIDDAGALDAVYERLGSQVATRKEKREVTAGLAGGALALIVAAASVSLLWFGRVP